MNPQTLEEQKIILNTAMDDVSTFFCKTRFNSENLPVKYIMHCLSDAINEFTNKIKESELVILNSIEKALTAISMTKDLKDFKLDLHSGQFCSYNGELFCIDPIYFGEFNYLKN